MTYAEKLKTPDWKTKAAMVKIRDGWQCRDCGKGDIGLEAHHTFYPTGLQPWECPDDLILSLCAPCHILRQKYEQAAHIALARLMKDWPVQRLERAVWFWISEELKGAGE